MRRDTLLLTTLFALPVTPVAAADWTQYQADARHSGYVPESFTIRDPHVSWTFAAPPYSGAPGDRSVAIDANHVYATVLDGYAPDGPYHVIAFDRANGSEEWRNSIAASVHSGVSAPSLGPSLLYVHGYGYSGRFGPVNPEGYPRLIGINPATGTRHFTTPHAGQGSSGSRPTVDVNQVFAAGGAYGGLDAYAATGPLQWSVDAPQNYGWIPAADSDYVYTYFGYLVANRRTSGATAFAIPIPGGTYHIYPNVVLGDDRDAFLLAHPGIVAFDLPSRSIKWTIPGTFLTDPAVGNGILAASTGDALWFFDAHTGATLWHWNAPRNLPYDISLRSNIILTDRYAFIGSTAPAEYNPATFAIDLQTHEAVWSVPVGGQLALAHETLVIANPTGLTAIALPEPSLPALSLAAITFLATRRRRHPC